MKMTEAKRAGPGVGEMVVYHDDEGKPQSALVTCVFEGSTHSINLVFVSCNVGRHDQYGRQIERRTSVPHKTAQSAHGFYWRWPEEEPTPYTPPAAT